MKKLFLSLIALFVCGVAHATMAEEFNYVPFSSYTDAATAGPVLFTSASVQFVGVTISSPSDGGIGYIAFYRSTSAAFTANLATQTLINTSFLQTGGPVYIPLFEMKNDSYTYFSKVGLADVTIWLRYPAMKKGRVGTYPGLPTSGMRESKIQFEQP